MDAMDGTVPYQEKPTEVKPLTQEQRDNITAKLLEAKVEQAVIIQVLKVIDDVGLPLLKMALTALA